ncbi:MAG: glutathione S-transferase [Rhizobiales bacterium 24-66-13]|jgi:GST-like protein|nr:MAG: glutathione S-transferase [Rhizobiales bacterium 24-66-13]OZB11641.1 MAG: glutathione S-transferase [Rhizobiales bacterium 39-66-18]HQS45866.1 glutathione S-transferase N-terminal domain-containing protein [Xanthobacteraceae bacterium]
MIDLYFWPTPNGYKAAIMLAELDLPHRVIPVDITAGEQFKPEFLKINPNNKVPAIVDHDGPRHTPYAVFESAAILIYLAEKTGKFIPQDPEGRYEALKWLIFQNTTMGPMLGQAHHFMVYANEKIDYAIERYDREVGRIYNILEQRLGENEYLAGAYSIADISTFPWIRTRKLHRRDLSDYPNINRWYQAIKDRPAVRSGLNTLSDNKTWEAKPGTAAWKNMFGKNAKP